MKDDYLWDRTGEPDADVERLEHLLGRFRHNRPAPEFPAQLPAEPQRGWRGWFLFSWPRLAAAFAVVLVVAATALYVSRSLRGGWEVERMAGAPLVNSTRVLQTARLSVGGWLVTDSAARARISVNAIGEVEVEPNSRLCLLEARSTEHRFVLERGTIHARIWAPPRLFFVETPSARVVDLGCRYTLQVEPGGAGRLLVTMGWVAFEQDGHESFVPAEGMCITRPGVGPGTPYYSDASESLRSSLERFDFDAMDSAAREAALSTVLAQARKRDALTLWHLLARTDGEGRTRVYDRLTQLVPPPAGVTREGILAGDRKMRDLWWDALGLGDAGWWRMWKGPVPAR